MRTSHELIKKKKLMKTNKSKACPIDSVTCTYIFCEKFLLSVGCPVCQ